MSETLDPPRGHLLVVDVGNSNIVLGVYDSRRLVHDWRVETRKGKTADEYGMLFRQLFQASGLNLDDVGDMILACVVPPLVEPMVSMASRYLKNKSCLVVGHGTRTGMPIRYENPREVGADRIVNAVAGYEHTGRASGVIVVDFGTATTFDVVSPLGEYLGGAIVPGVGISLDALFHQASKLPRIELVAPKSSIGRNTVSSMQSGVIFGYVGLVDGLVTRMVGELDFKPYVVATGGIATLIGPMCATIQEVLPFLTLEGLRILWERNR